MWIIFICFGALPSFVQDVQVNTDPTDHLGAREANALPTIVSPQTMDKHCTIVQAFRKGKEETFQRS